MADATGGATAFQAGATGFKSPILTAAPTAASTLVNRAAACTDADAATVAADARGATRPLGGACDTGAHELTLIAAPTLTDTDPDSPAEANNPKIKGSAPGAQTVRLYPTADCTGPAVEGSAADFASPGFTVSVGFNSVTTFHATATNSFGEVSPCSTSSITFVNQILLSVVPPVVFAPPPAEFATDAGSNDVAIGDFNDDGVEDLLTANLGANNVSVLLGTGSGSFARASNLAAGSEPGSVAVGDFNNDDAQDFAVANRRSNDVSVRLGNGNGGFGAREDLHVGADPRAPAEPRAVAIGNFNRGSNEDLFTANSDSSTVSVHFGDGDGSFGLFPDRVFSVGSSAEPRDITVADLDGDGFQDFATANFDNNNVAVRFGNGNGGLSGSINVSAGIGPTSVATINADGDTLRDLVVGSQSDGVRVLLGVAPRDYELSSLNTHADADSIAVGDFNRDFNQDFASASPTNPPAVFLGAGDGAFDLGPDIDFGFGTPRSVAVADLNDDGVQDLVGALGGSVSILRNAGTATSTPGSLGFGSLPQGAVSGPQTVTITNNGAAPLIVDGFEFIGANPGDYFTGLDTCNAPVVRGDSCTVAVRFAPQGQGTRTATLGVVSDAGTPANSTVTLVGTGSGATEGVPGPAGPPRRRRRSRAQPVPPGQPAPPVPPVHKALPGAMPR